MAIYRGMDIGTAKPTVAEQAAIPHHLLDVVEPEEEFSVAQYVAHAAADGREIRARGREVLFVGGTPLYLKSLLRGLFDGPPANWQFRREIEEEVEPVGQEAIHERLAQVDPLAASLIHPNDTRRIMRALEVYRATGQPIQPSADGIRRWPGGRRVSRVHPAAQRGELHAESNGASTRCSTRAWSTRCGGSQPKAALGRTASQAVGYREALAQSGRRDRHRADAIPHAGPHTPVCQAARDLVPQPFRVPVRRHCGRRRHSGDRRADCGSRVSVVCARNRPSNDNAICSDRSIWGQSAAHLACSRIFENTSNLQVPGGEFLARRARAN